jgi:hypothetical protein
LNDIDGDNLTDLLLSVPREDGIDPKIPIDLGIFRGKEVGLEVEPSWKLYVTGYPNDTFVVKAGTLPDPLVPGRNWTWIYGAKAGDVHYRIYFLRQPIPFLKSVSVNGTPVLTMNDHLTREITLDIANYLREALEGILPATNGSVPIDIGFAFSGEGSINVTGIEVEYYSVRPPVEVSAGPLPDGNAVVISWEANGDDATQYRLWSNHTGDWEVLSEMAAVPSTYTHQGLVDGRTYFYRFQALNPSLGIESDLGRTISVVPADIIAPPPPNNVTVEALAEGNTLILSWDDVGGDCEGYELFLVNGSERTSLAILERGTTRFFHTGLVDGVEHSYSISARDEVPNWSPLSAPITGIPMDTLPPAIPQNFRIFPVTEGNSLHLEWTCDEEDVSGYRIFLLENGNWFPLMNTTTTHATVSNLINGEEYILCVAAVDEVPNESGLSDSASGTPEDTLPPLVPVNLTAIPGLGEGEIALHWNLNDDDTVGYTVERSIDGVAWEVVVRTNVTSLVDGGKQLGTTYFYRVFAIDDDGLVSTPSGPVTSEPRDLTPPAPPIIDPVPEFLATKELTVTGTTEPNATVEVLLESVFTATGSADTMGHFEIHLEDIGEGVHSLEARAKDKWNNTSPVSGTRWFTVDTIGPEVIKIIPDLSHPLAPGTILEIKLSEECVDLSVVIKSIETSKEIQLSPVSPGDNNTHSFQIPLTTKPGDYTLLINGSDRTSNELVFNQDIRISSANEGEGNRITYLLISIAIVAIVIILLTLMMQRRNSTPTNEEKSTDNPENFRIY